MASYGYTTVVFHNYGILCSSTDSQVIDWFCAEVKRLVSSCHVLLDQFPSGNKWRCRIDKLQGQDEGILWWLTRQLCLNGWEPLGEGQFRRKCE
jgi:hypothetical protein